jgi:hypothetical protein
MQPDSHGKITFGATLPRAKEMFLFRAWQRCIFSKGNNMIEVVTAQHAP